MALTVEDFIKYFFLREEMEYDMPDDPEKYVASATNRFLMGPTMEPFCVQLPNHS